MEGEEAFNVGAAQITIADLESRTGLDFGELKNHDHFSQSGETGTLEGVVTDPHQRRIKPIYSGLDILV